MADIQVNSSVGVDGNSYTTAISNDKLTNDDFLKLMIQELKMQDPTKPMDSEKMLTTQMNMSTLSTNQEMIKAMQSMQTAFSQTAISNAAGIIGKNVEDGNVAADGSNKAYTVRSVENVNGEVQARVQQILYLENRVVVPNATDSTKSDIVDYNEKGEILDSKGVATGDKIVLTSPGVPLVTDGKLTILDKNNNPITNNKYSLAGSSVPVYSDQLSNIPFSTITKIF
jgi:flagellar basal-body rod modification protein FlgD